MSNYIQNIPKELISDIVARVAASSLTDYVNLKLSCKMLKEVAQNSCVELHTDETTDFINRCVENGNSDALYRLGMVQYFGFGNLDMALKYLNKSASLDHVGAYYVICIILLYENFIKEGVDFLSTMKMSREYIKKVKSYRNHVIKILRLISINNPTVLRRRPICCNKNHELVTAYARVGTEDEEEDYVFCDACTCDIEMAHIFAVLPSL